MRIEWSPPVGRAKARRDDKSDPATEGHFASSLAADAPPAPAAPATTLGVIDSLLSIQEMPDALAGRRRAVQRGSTLLDRLDDLRLALLSGVLPRERLAELARVAGTARDAVDDPRLVGVLDEIELRVRVELAKLDAVL